MNLRPRPRPRPRGFIRGVYVEGDNRREVIHDVALCPAYGTTVPPLSLANRILV